MRFLFCAFAILVMTLVACATPATPTVTLVPPTATSIPAVKPAATNAPAPTQAAAASAASCATTNAAPPDKFRSDDPKKLEASAKPKLVEFFAYW